MSNEFFFNEYQSGHSNVTPTSYMDLARIYATRIQALYPAMKIAVATEPGNTNWNTAIQNYTPAFYDALVLHEYYNHVTCLSAGNTCTGA